MPFFFSETSCIMMAYRGKETCSMPHLFNLLFDRVGMELGTRTKPNQREREVKNIRPLKSRAAPNPGQEFTTSPLVSLLALALAPRHPPLLSSRPHTTQQTDAKPQARIPPASAKQSLTGAAPCHYCPHLSLSGPDHAKRTGFLIMAGDRRGGGSPAAERRRGIRRLLLPRGEASSSFSPSPPPPLPAPAEVGRRKGFASAALRGLGCASAAASQAYAPGSGAGSAAAAAVRSSADWHGRRRKGKDRRKERGGGGGGGGGGLVAGGIGADVWCAPGIPFAAEASSVDCVVARHQMLGRGRGGGEAERPHRERPCLSRRATMQEQISSSFMESPPPPPHLDGPFFGADLLPSARLRRMRGYRPSPGGLEEEIMMFQTRVLLGGMSMYDRYQDWRLDVDNMTYEELLELGERIGHVNTGLREDEIIRNLRKVKHPAFDSSFRFPTEIEKKCSICQEEFEANDEMGRLHCGHSYHVYCIKQWLSQKNVCPVCKTAVTKT